MLRFETEKALNNESAELERQQKKMPAAIKKDANINKESVEHSIIIDEKIALVKSQTTERITLRLPSDVHNSIKILGKFEDNSLNGIITKACMEYIAKQENQEKIKIFNKIL